MLRHIADKPLLMSMDSNDWEAHQIPREGWVLSYFASSVLTAKAVHTKWWSLFWWRRMRSADCDAHPTQASDCTPLQMMSNRYLLLEIIFGFTLSSVLLWIRICATNTLKWLRTFTSLINRLFGSEMQCSYHWITIKTKREPKESAKHYILYILILYNSITAYNTIQSLLMSSLNSITQE